ncbi:hypothetical protein NCS52_00332000 [Fusarium sp. LHS14.1]|nr:hypothetical protein NCS52_00332000 [Fusarium sp. LHS14.1]
MNSSGDSGSQTSWGDAGPGSSFKSWQSALFLDDENRKFLGEFRDPGRVEGTAVYLILSAKPDKEPWMGFSIRFLLGPSNDHDGFGIRYRANRTYGTPTALRQYRPFVKLPRGGFTYTAEAIPKGHTLHGRAWKKKNDFTLLKVSLEKGFHANIGGYCMPFAYPYHMADSWFNDNAPIAGTKPLRQLLEQREFTILVCATHNEILSKWHENILPPPFSNPYGRQHTWDMHRYQAMIPWAQGYQFEPAWFFHDDNSHLAALTQSQVQGAVWLRNSADSIATLELSALFTDARLDVLESTYYVIVPIKKHYNPDTSLAWKHLSRRSALQLCLCDDPKAVEWEARIVHRPHDTNTIKAAGFDCERKVDAICQFHPKAMPPNPVAVGLRTDASGQLLQAIPMDLQLKMSYHRDLLHGTGFYSTMRQQGTEVLQDANYYHWALPTVDILDGIDKTHVDAMMEEVALADRPRLRNYLGKRPLGLGIITGISSSDACCRSF